MMADEFRISEFGNPRAFAPLLGDKYCLIHEKERFIVFKTRGAAGLLDIDKTRVKCINEFK